MTMTVTIGGRMTELNPYMAVVIPPINPRLSGKYFTLVEMVLS